MTVTGPAATLQLRDNDKVLEPYRLQGHGMWGGEKVSPPHGVWISSADDEGPNEADVEAGIDGAA